MSPRKSRTAAIQATKALQTTKKQSTRAKKKPEPKKNKPVKNRNPAKNKNNKKPVQVTESNAENEISGENTSQTHSISESRKQAILNRKKVITQERLLNAINKIGGIVGARNENRVKTETETEEIPLTQAMQEETQGECADEIGTTEQRTIYSCKFCNKDFSSAFVLFLHIRIHEKVGSIPEPVEETKPVALKEEEELHIEEEKELHIEEDECSDDELQIKEEIIEEITIPDADDELDEPVENDPLQIDDEPKTEFVGVINKNFVESLRKNLSLAMNRQIN